MGIDWKKTPAAIWRQHKNKLRAVKAIDPIRLSELIGIERQKSRDAFVSASMRADDSSVGTWRNTFYPSEMAEIDAEAGDLLRQLGYVDD